MPRKTSEIPMSTTTFHTFEPLETPPQYADGLYRHIAGIESETGLLMHPDIPMISTRPIEAEVPTHIIENAKWYFDKYYIRYPQLQRNCHIAAAAIVRGLELNIIDAAVEGWNIIGQGVVVSPTTLAIGARGIFGATYEGDPFPFHAVVGVDEGIGIQTDSINGFFSIVSTEHSFAHYQAEVTEVSPNFPPLQIYSD